MVYICKQVTSCLMIVDVLFGIINSFIETSVPASTGLIKRVITEAVCELLSECFRLFFLLTLPAVSLSELSKMEQSKLMQSYSNFCFIYGFLTYSN